MTGFYLDIAEKYREGFSTETDHVDGGKGFPTDAGLEMPLPLQKNRVCPEMEGTTEWGE